MGSGVRGWCAVAVVVGLWTLPQVPSAEAAPLVICKGRNGIRLRETACRRREQQLDVADLGATASPVGPAGGALAGSYPAPSLASGAIASPAAFASGAIPAARVALTSPVAINGGALTVSWQQEDFDTANLFDAGSPTLMTAPVDGLYQVDVSVLLTALTAGSGGDVRIGIAGAGFTQAGSQAHELSGSVALAASALLALNAGQSVNVRVTTNSGGSPGLGGSPNVLAMHWVGPR